MPAASQPLGRSRRPRARRDPAASRLRLRRFVLRLCRSRPVCGRQRRGPAPLRSGDRVSRLVLVQQRGAAVPAPLPHVRRRSPSGSRPCPLSSRRRGTWRPIFPRELTTTHAIARLRQRRSVAAGAPWLPPLPDPPRGGTPGPRPPRLRERDESLGYHRPKIATSRARAEARSLSS